MQKAYSLIPSSEPDSLGGIVLKGPRLLNVLVEGLPALVAGVLFHAPLGLPGADRLRDKARQKGVAEYSSGSSPALSACRFKTFETYWAVMALSLMDPPW